MGQMCNSAAAANARPFLVTFAMIVLLKEKHAKDPACNDLKGIRGLKLTWNPTLNVQNLPFWNLSSYSDLYLIYVTGS